MSNEQINGELEREVKLFFCPEDTFERLLEMGGKLVKDEKQENFIYAINGEKIRFRSIFTPKSLSYEIIKKVDVADGDTGIKTKIEIPFMNVDKTATTTSTVDFIKFRSLMEWLVSPVFEGNKTRKSILFNGFLFEFDVWNDEVLPIPYIELEIPKYIQNVDLAIDKMIRRLFTRKERDKIIKSVESITVLSENFKKSGSPFINIPKKTPRLITKETLELARQLRLSQYYDNPNPIVSKPSSCYIEGKFNPDNWNGGDGGIIRDIIYNYIDLGIMRNESVNYYVDIIHKFTIPQDNIFIMKFYNQDGTPMMITNDLYADYLIKQYKHRGKIDMIAMRSVYTKHDRYRTMTEEGYIKMLNLLYPLLSDRIVDDVYTPLAEALKEVK